MIRIKPERDVCPQRKRMLDMYRVAMTGWPEMLKVQIEMNRRKKPHVTDLGKLLSWLSEMNVTEYTLLQ